MHNSVVTPVGSVIMESPCIHEQMKGKAMHCFGGV